MILALVAKGKKTIACGMLALIYLETVIPSYALGSNTPVAYTKGKTVVNPGVLKRPVAFKPAVTAAAVRPRAVAKGNIGGPTQPEGQAFHSANNDNMVDLFSGDFTYNIPLMDVGGYPITIGYNSGISMDQEASWVGLGWNINPGTITRNMRGLPDDFNGRDTIVKTTNIKENKTAGVTSGADIELLGLPLNMLKGEDSSLSIGFGASLGLFRNNYTGWGMEYGLNASINVAKSGLGGFTGGLSITNNTKEGVTLSPSFSAYLSGKTGRNHQATGSFSVTSSYNTLSGVKGLQISGGIRQSATISKNAKQNDNFATSYQGSVFSSLISFANPSYIPSVSLPYTSKNITVTLKAGFETKIVHPSFFISGYIAEQKIAEEDRHAYLPAYGYLNYQNGAGNPGALMDFNREKEIPYREKPDVVHIAVPSYTYDVFSMSGEGTGGCFRAYRSDIGFIYDHYVKSKDGSQRYSGDIGFGDLVHGGVDLNLNRSFTQSGPWVQQNPLAKLIGFKQQDTTFEPAYFRNPGEKTANSKEFYEAIGGDDAIAPDIYQPGSSSSIITTTHKFNRYKNGLLLEKIAFPDSPYKKVRDKRTQVISYLTANEAQNVGFAPYIENYKENVYALQDCSTTFLDDLDTHGLWGSYYHGSKFEEGLVTQRVDPVVQFDNGTMHAPAGGWDDRFSVRWVGRVKAPVTGTYTFYTFSDDGTNLWINDKELIGNLVPDHEIRPRKGIPVNLVAGEVYDIKVEYTEYAGMDFMNLYWEYPGHPMHIIPSEYLYTPPKTDIFTARVDTLFKEKRVNSFRKANHISEVSVLNSDGRRYVYGIPVYNFRQKEATFSVEAIDGNKKEGLVKYAPGIDDDVSNTKGNDHYFNSEEVRAYAHSFLLTAILSPDYTDLTGDGITSDDPGDAIKFKYSKIAGVSNPYKWRAPYTDSASYDQGLRTDDRDDKGNYVYGEKELWYLNSVESKNMIATFKLATRDDLWPIDSTGNKIANNNGRRLEEINLYTKADFRKNGIHAIPIKTVHFEYSYELCAGVNKPRNNNGKLTLKKIWFTYNGNDKGQRNPYIFHYNDNNPGYNVKSSDRWGSYKDPLQNPGSSTNDLITNEDYPYALQDSTLAAKNAAAWTLDSIVLPSGGRIKVTYESDDYAFVQNKRAMQLLKVAGFSATVPTDLDDLSNKLYGDKEHLYVGINVPDPVNNAAELSYKYLEGIQKIYFKLFVNMPADKYGGGGEYVPCYARIDPSEAGFINDGKTIWIKLKGINAEGNDGEFSPLAQAAIQFLRLNLPSKAMPGSDIGEDLDLDVAVRMLFSMADNIKNTFRSFDKLARAKEFAAQVDLSRTLVRVNSPRFKKYGGGLRVKRLVTYDNWKAMSKQNQKESVYGQEYQYTAVREVGGERKEISSGVATYEPMLGGEENPWRLPIEYQQQLAPLAPVTLGYTEEPLGESFFPGPSVGYSKVRVRSIHTKNTRSANGWAETGFYTSYDFPTLTEMTNLSDSKKKYKPALANFLRINAKHYLTISQGFKIELNDMHGKLRSQAYYAETDPKTPITYTENYYRVDDQHAEFKHLNNTVMAIDPTGKIDATASIGKDIELMMDMREQLSVTNGNNFNVNGDFFTFGLPPVWLIPTLLSLVQREENRFRSAAATKVINRHGILDSVVVIDKGSKVVTRNLLYDAESGEPVLTSTRNEFNDPVFNFTYPSGWAYEGMSGAYKNINVYLKHIAMADGKMRVGPVAGINRYFTAGDEVLAWSKQRTGDIGACAFEAATFPNAYKLWVVDANIMNGGSPDLYFVDGNGTPFTGLDMTIKVIRSGRRNIATAVGAVSMLKDPLASVTQNGITSWALQINNDSRVLNAAATEFQQLWKVEDKRNVSYVTTCAPITYEQYLDDGACINAPYYNAEVSQTFTKNDCGPGGVPDSSYTYVVAEGTYTSTVSQAQADSFALANITANGQLFANSYTNCIYQNAEIKKTFTKNDCPGDTLSAECGVAGAEQTVVYTIPAGKYTSTVSKAEADSMALKELNDLGQAYANSSGICTYYNLETARAFTRNDCANGAVVIYTVPAGTYMSSESQQEADSLAEADIQRNGQAFANQNGACGNQVYVKRVYKNITVIGELRKADIYFEFYSDAAFSTPVSVSNLPVNWKTTRSNCDGSGEQLQDTGTKNCSGTSQFLSNEIIREDDGDGPVHCWRWDYQVTEGTGYIAQ